MITRPPLCLSIPPTPPLRVVSQVRLQDSKNTTLQKKALELLLSGEGMPLKQYPPTNWAPPNDTPREAGAPSTQYAGPYPMEVSGRPGQEGAS